MANTRNALSTINYGSVVNNLNDQDWSLPNNGHETTDTLLADGLLLKTQLKRRIWSNVLLFNVATFLSAMGLVPVMLIQSSFNSKDGLGVTSMAVNYATMIVSSFILPSVIQKISCKWALVIGMLLNVPYILANLYPTFYTLVPLAILGGLGNTMQGISAKVYLSRIAYLYSDITNIEADRISARIFVLEICVGSISAAIGSFSSSLILNAGQHTGEDNATLASNYTNSQLSICGVNYCNEELAISNPLNDAEYQYQTQTNVGWLILFSAGMTILSGLTMIFLSPLKKFGILPVTEQSQTSILSNLMDVLKAMKDLKHLLFIPMAIALNGGDAFGMADFNQAFVSCSIGMSYLGFVAVWSCLSSTVATVSFGWFNSKKMRMIPVISTTVFQLTSLTALFYWSPSLYTTTANYWILSIFSIVFMFGAGIRRLITLVLVAVVFKDNIETGFSVFNLWTNAASTLFFAWSTALCIKVKMYFLLSAIVVSLFCFIGISIVSNQHANFKNSQKYRRLSTSNDE
ncbi:Protein unc-93 A [Chamberlinius hualienensis]